MKRFMYLSIALLCLSLSALIAVHVGHHNAQATIVTDPVGVILAVSEDFVLTTTEEIWTYNDNMGWLKLESLPIPLSQVHFFDSEGAVHMVDKNGDYWELLDHVWFNRGQPPVGPVPTGQKSWGTVKNKYNPEGKR